MPEEWFKVNIPDGQHLGKSADDPTAYRGLKFNEDGDLVGHANLRRPEPGEPTPDDYQPQYAYQETAEEAAERRRREQEDEEFNRMLVQAAITLAILAAPHVRRWWKITVVPALKAAATAVRERRAARKATKAARRAARKAAKDAAKKAAEEAVVLLAPASDNSELAGGTKAEVALALDSARHQMTSDEARERFTTAMAARYFSDEQLRLLDGAEIIDPTGRALTSDSITSLDVQKALKELLVAHPEVLLADSPEEARSLLGKALEDEPRRSKRHLRILGGRSESDAS